MKKFTTLFVSLALLISLTACGNSTQSQAAAPSSAPQAASVPTSQPAASANESTSTSESASVPATTEGGKTLVVYYSATGNTAEAAGYIAEITGADTLALEPSEPYTTEDLNYRNSESRVSYEHDNPDARDIALVADTVDNWAEYDTVFIGYPIWWGIAAWPVNGFIEANDFTGKTVIPFASSASSGMGESGTLLAEAAGTGDWQEGTRFSSGASQDAVVEWVEGLGL